MGPLIIITKIGCCRTKFCHEHYLGVFDPALYSLGADLPFPGSLTRLKSAPLACVERMQELHKSLLALGLGDPLIAGMPRRQSFNSISDSSLQLNPWWQDRFILLNSCLLPLFTARQSTCRVACAYVHDEAAEGASLRARPRCCPFCRHRTNAALASLVSWTFASWRCWCWASSL